MEENGSLVEDLGLVAVALESLQLGSDNPRIRELARDRDRLTRSIRSYLIPRVSGDEVPLTVVFAGPTGSGKSTLVNSLSGLDISETGPVRPTTTGPVVLAARRHSSGFSQISGVGCEVVLGAAPILSDIALVDTPDIDSTSLHNRATAEILIDNADIVVFVTSVLRYSDLVPWEVLRRAVSRGAPVIHVLNRITANSMGAVTDFRSLLERQGMDPDIIRIPEHHVAPDIHHVPSLAVRGLQKRIVALVSDIDTTRRGIVERVLSSTARDVIALAEALEDEIGAVEDSDELTRTSFHAAVKHLDMTWMFDGALSSDFPTGSLRRLGWRWRNRVGRSRWKALGDEASRRLVALVEADLRGLAVREKRSIPANLVVEARTTSAAASAAWLEEVMDASKTTRVLGRGLAALILADAAARRETPTAFDTLLADRSLLERMIASLEGRLVAIYESTARQMSEDLDRLPFAGSDADLLRLVASSLILRSQFADA